LQSLTATSIHTLFPFNFRASSFERYVICDFYFQKRKRIKFLKFKWFVFNLFVLVKYPFINFNFNWESQQQSMSWFYFDEIFACKYYVMNLCSCMLV
jgi:hypothetical protein